MKRIGIEIPGWPAYTIDDKEVVRSYMNVYAMQGEGKIIKGSNRCHHLHRLGEDGKIEDLWCSKRKLLASAKLGIDPANVNLRDLVVNDNGEWVSRRDFARQMGIECRNGVLYVRENEPCEYLTCRIRALDIARKKQKTFGSSKPVTVLCWPHQTDFVRRFFDGIPCEIIEISLNDVAAELTVNNPVQV